MSDLQIFKNNEFGEIRTIVIGNEPYLMLADVCRVLDIKNSRDTKSRLNKDGVVTTDTIDSLNRTQQADFINESNFYKVVFQSRKPQAEKFTEYVTSEVLPSIRKHGAYLTDEKIEEVLMDPDTIIKLATQLKEERSRRLEAERFNKQIAISENSLLVREVAKIASKDNIVIGEKRLWNKLREWGLIFKDTTEPKQEYIDRGYFEVVEGAKDTYKGTFTYRTTRVTGKGQVYIIKRLIKEKEIA